MKNPINEKGNAAKQFAHEFNNVSFPENDDSFRAAIAFVKEGVILWLENKKTKQQWQLIVADFSKCGPSGIPREAVIAFLKVNY